MFREVVARLVGKKSDGTYVEVGADDSGNIFASPSGVVSTLNSTETALTSGSTFTGDWEMNNHPDLVVSVKTDQNGTLYVDFSPDGVNNDSTLSFIYDTSKLNKPHRLVKGSRYTRVRFENTSASDQTFLRLNLSFGTFGPLTSPISGTLAENEDGVTVRSIDHEFDIVAGRAQGKSIVNKFGRNSDVGGAEDLWEGGGEYTGHPYNVSDTVDISSSDATDDAGAVGARNIHIYGLDANFALQDEVVVMDGTTSVTSSGTYARVFRGIVESAGSDADNAGVITCHHTSTSDNKFFAIPAGDNQTKVAAYTVPAGKTGYLRKIYSSINRGSGSGVVREADIGLYIRAFQGVWRNVRPFEISSGNFVDFDIYGGVGLPEKTDVKIRVDSVETSGTDISGGFDIILVDD